MLTLNETFNINIEIIRKNQREILEQNLINEMKKCSREHRHQNRSTEVKISN